MFGYEGRWYVADGMRHGLGFSDGDGGNGVVGRENNTCKGTGV